LSERRAEALPFLEDDQCSNRATGAPGVSRRADSICYAPAPRLASTICQYRRHSVHFRVRQLEAVMLIAPDSLASILAITLALALVALALAGVLCYRLLVERGRLLLDHPDEVTETRESLRSPGLAADSYLSDFALPTLGDDEGYGNLVTLSGLTGQPLLLVLLQPGCFSSRAFARELAAMPPESGAPLVVAIVAGEGDQEALAPFAALPGVVLRDPDAQTLRLLLIAATPTGYLVNARRRTVGAMLRGPEALLRAARGHLPLEETASLVALTAIAPPNLAITPLQPGDVAPAFTLPGIDGRSWSLDAHRGTTLALLFSDPSCPPCVDLLQELSGPLRQHLVVISRGDRAANAALIATAAITAPVLLQRQREIARRFGALDTPSAYVVDGRGFIVAGPAVGKEAVLALLRESVSEKRGISAGEV
jgi:peroxiredoxin